MARKRSSHVDSPMGMMNLIFVVILLAIVYQMVQQSNQTDTLYESVMYPQVIVVESESESESDDEDPYRDDIYRRPVRNPPFNYPTRGPPGKYDMVGFLQDSSDPSKLQQLYGRPTYPNSNQWNYYVKSDQYHQIPIPVTISGDNCTDERGCKELSDQSTVQLMNQDHTATIYKPEPYYYNPYVV